MQNSKMLEMLNSGRIEDLRAALQDEIYAESLKGKPTAKKRYAAMKKYLKTISPAREILTKPCAVEVHGENYIAFTNTYSLALTTESCGEIEMCDEPDRYPPVAKLISFDGNEDTIDFNKVLAEAKSKGYKFSKNAIFSNEYLMRYNGGYFRIALVDCTYGVIDDGKPVTVYHNGDRFGRLTIKNDIGVCLILPIRYDGDPEADNYVVIDAQ